MTRAARAGAFVMGGIACLIAACTSNDQPTCYRGEYVTCACNNSQTGYAMCLADETAHGTCDCSGAIPGLEGGAPQQDAGGAADANDAGGKLALMQPCDRDDQCETGLCFPFNAKGPHCSKRCKSDTDCPSPSTGCSNMGVCKAP
ncbi:MAG TPA: hypothetical protein VNO21_02110 [Polyangiaceae bacterium]|nr:hypothetical protein [Polyangiaceae bacterium]